MVGRATDRMRAITMRQRALVAGDLTEHCDGKFFGGDVPEGDPALTDEATATKAAIGPNGGIRHAYQHNFDRHHSIGALARDVYDRFRDSLRVSPPPPDLSAGGILPTLRHRLRRKPKKPRLPMSERGDAIPYHT